MIDFNEVKQAVSIGEVAKNFLHLDIEDRGTTLRSFCPACKTGDLRAILITPERGLFYCFASKKGGDSISLVAHIQGVTMRESAERLAGAYLNQKPTQVQKVSEPQGFNPEEYISKLDTSHELVKKAGVSEELAKRIGMGVAKKGVNAGKLAFPLYDREGNLLFFASSTDLTLPKFWRAT